MTTKPHVPDDGSLHAPIVVVGEAPGAHEEREGRPFVGPSGERLAAWWRRVGLERKDCYLTNVLPWRPEVLERVPREEIEAAAEALRARLAKCRARVIVPLGNYALYALTGRGHVPWQRSTRTGILDWRGSMLSTTLGDRTLWVIPTVHPAAVLRTPSWERRALRDWQRIADLVRYGPPPRIAWEHRVPTLDELHGLSTTTTDRCVLDIETPRRPRTEMLTLGGEWVPATPDRTDVVCYKSGARKGQPKTRTVPGERHIACIGLAVEAGTTWTVPLEARHWGPEWPAVQVAVRRLLAQVPAIVTQNGVSFDLPWLVRDGWLAITPSQTYWDTRCMHHVLDPRDDHDLAYLASMYTKWSYWKLEARETYKYANADEALWTYCGMDVAVTWEVFDALRKELVQHGLAEFYFRHVTRLIPAVLAMTAHGFRVDAELLRTRRAALEAEAQRLREGPLTVDGMPLVVQRGLSDDRVKYVLYGARGLSATKVATLKAKFPAVRSYGFLPLKKRRTAGKGSTVTADEAAVRRLWRKYESRDGWPELARALLAYRQNRKHAEVLNPDLLDTDGRMRCSFSFVTEAGRLASAATPWGLGRNLQNIDPALRDIFVPDQPNEVIVEADLSQVESRVVFALTNDPELQRLANTPPWEYDTHAENARAIFGAEPSDPDWKLKRHIGKIVSHGAQRGMGGARLSDRILCELNLVIPVHTCDAYVEAYHRSKPAIREHYFRWVRRCVLRDRRLVNSWGRVMRFDFDRLNDDVFRQAYSFLPQSEAADLMNQCGLWPAWCWAESSLGRPPLLQVHDSVVLSVPPDMVPEIVRLLERTLMVPRPIGGTLLRVPVTFKVSARWGGAGGVEWTRLPSDAEMREVAWNLCRCP